MVIAQRPSSSCRNPCYAGQVRFEGFDSTLETDRDTGNGGLDNEDATVDNDDIEGDDQDTDTLGCDRTATRQVHRERAPYPPQLQRVLTVLCMYFSHEKPSARVDDSAALCRHERCPRNYGPD